MNSGLVSAGDRSYFFRMLNLIAAAPLAVPQTLALGYSLLYLLFGGGIGGAILVFFAAKAFGK